MAARVLSQPAWVNDLELLRQKIYSIVARVVDPKHLNALFDETAVLNYWVKCFTHKSVDANNNYESLEFYGDKALNYAFATYIRRRFDDHLDQEKATLVLNKYMSKQNQAKLAVQLGLDQLVRFDPDSGLNINVQEDVFESFFGCLNNLVDDRIGEGLGNIYCRNLITEIFNDIDIALEEVQKDSKTKLKELYEKMGWGEPQYVTVNSEDPRKGEMRVDIRSATGEIIGTGYGSQKSAAFKAAENALNKLAEQNINLEVAEQRKIERSRNRNTEFDKQWRRVEAAINNTNEQARRQGKAQIKEFKIHPLGSHRTQGQGGSTMRYTYAIQVAYNEPDGRLTWKNIHQLTGDDSEKTKILLMKGFADAYKIPENI